MDARILAVKDTHLTGTERRRLESARRHLANNRREEPEP